ncbi:O-antigen ligase family protein [Teichococcus aestuarii]|uniref:O-antigen ligase family protein n=1 Tax=Teichococcus aestuarii TaxID=568898 RepID=UPI001FECD4F5|nr:O-antigen ligase family protein [Pseudoroseomonas aestuarii]
MSAPRIDSAALGSLAGAAAAILHLAGALKSTPLGAALPVDLTLLAGALLLPLLAVLGLTRRWWLHPGLGPPLAGAALLWLWLVLAGSWSGSRAILAAKLPEVVLLAPVMLLAGLAVGADAGARRLAVAVTLASGPLVAVSVAVGLATGQVVLGGMAGTAGPDMLRVQYQLAGLAIACAAGLSAVRLVESRGWAGRLLWGGLTALLAAASLLPGGRTALAALVLAVLLVPALRCWSAGAPRRALGWVALAALGAAAALATLLLDEDAASGLRTLERLTQGDLEGSARPALWRAALAWGAETLPWGLGTGGFTPAAGHGERRGLYPHNHLLEAWAEGGVPGLLLWLLAFGGGGLLLLLRCRQVAPARVARIAALVLPVALAAMVSTDLGNRMVWFALGLALSIGVGARRV